MSSLSVRLACADDLASIRTIYNHYVHTSTCTYQLEPETEVERAQWFAAHGPQHPVTVVEEDGAILGWGLLSCWNARAGYRRTVENSVYIHHEHHRRGIGRALLTDLLERAASLGHHAVIAGASADQTASIALHVAMGFEEVARFREVGWKFERWLDVVYLQKLVR